MKALDDAIINLGSLQKANSRLANKDYILQQLSNHNYANLREISNLFFETSGIYARACKYIAYLYRYDWFIVPYVQEGASANEQKMLKDFSNILNYLDNSYIKAQCDKIALEVVKNGCYYGYVINTGKSFSFQDLPASYCRSRFSVNGFPAVEFNMRYFDEQFNDVEYRMRVIKMFPKEFAKGYVLYKQGKLKGDYSGDTAGWYLLDTASAFKINCGGSDFPILANAIPAIIDLDEAQGLDRKKQMQKLLKIIIQKLPLDKNGDLLFDMDEMRDMHNNAVAMLKRAIGVDVLTTIADVDVADMSDRNSTTTQDDLAKVERTIYNNFGSSQNLFNSDSNLALSNSILNDEASVRFFQQQFERFFNKLIEEQFKVNTKKYYFRFRMLETTIYNYKDMSKLYEQQMKIGYSKMLAQIALGHSQSEILATAHFENEVLELATVMIPPMASNTMNSEVLRQVANKDGESQTGRPKKADNEKSDKTLANEESM